MEIMNDTPLFQINKEKCTLCFACVRVCPVKAIEVKKNNDFATILPNRCVGCGSCYTICPYGAISYRDSKEEAKALLNSNNNKVAIVAPSISGEFNDITDYRKFVQMIKALGFDYVNEVSFGVDLVAREYAELFENFRGKHYLTSTCPVVVSTIEKFHPELIENLAPIISPMIASARVAKQLYGEHSKIIYIGPCIQSKDEAKRYKEICKIDSVLTFIELRELFEEFNIKEQKVEFSEFDPPSGNKGGLYPVSNGLLQAGEINENLLNSEIITTEGRNDFLEAIKKFETSIDTIQKHFNIFYCDGCLMGPGTSKDSDKYIRHTLVVNYAQKKVKNLDKAEWQKNIDNAINSIELKTAFKNDDQRITLPSEGRINEILKTINKDNIHSDSGCGVCGYDSCKDFAVAVSKGLAKTEMCLSYSLKNKHNYINTLKATNEKLNQIKVELKKSEEIAHREKKSAKEASDIVSTMLQKLPSSIVIIDKDLKILQANQSFINTLGEDAIEISEIIPGLAGADLKTLVPYNVYKLFSFVLSKEEEILSRDVQLGEQLLNISIFTIKKNKIVGAVVRDMYSPEVRRDEVINRVTDVIDKNLELVQQIGFLLGEGASETEQMLNSIIKSYKSEKK